MEVRLGLARGLAVFERLRKPDDMVRLACAGTMNIAMMQCYLVVQSAEVEAKA